jgi:hypothetical protein
VGNCITLIRALKRRGSQDRPRGKPERTSKVEKEYKIQGLEISGWIGNCETSFYSHQKAQKHQACDEAAENVGQGRMHCFDQNKWHQIISEGRQKWK